ncbi:VOC family protein [Agrobacterium vitis]|uniref:VOC family protein n=1 Tax=Rhizobium/Agrobacterium group TaxID=227290 RepID=UPI0012E771CB|nr:MULTISPECIES: VOC family protein [Rhizobium/Agrobacterium group]MCF1492913.1 VOC family protein [Allorhizobium ampelinum]MVA45711.1 VOC family protein [Agrobacterium vitis]
MIAIKGLYETHLTVSNLDRSIDFYRDVVGLEFAHRIPSRNVAFFWVGGRDRSMLGLWSIHSSPLRMRLHIAFQTTLDEILRAPEYLKSRGVVPRRGGGSTEINEPVVFPWVPAASVYFDDPDGHSLEFITVLHETPRPEISGTVTFKEWEQMNNRAEL